MLVHIHCINAGVGPQSRPSLLLTCNSRFFPEFALLLIWGPKVSLLPNVIPKYSASPKKLREKLHTWSLGDLLGSSFLLVNITIMVSSTPNSNQFAKLKAMAMLMASCPLSVREGTSGPLTTKVAVSTNSFASTGPLSNQLWSLKAIFHTKGENILPWGVPLVRSLWQAILLSGGLHCLILKIVCVPSYYVRRDAFTVYSSDTSFDS